MHGFILGGMRGFIWGACVVFSRGCMVLLGGMRGFIRGACMVLFRGACMVLLGHAWFYSGGMGGMRGFSSFFGYNEIRSMSGRYASYWNAFLY